MVEANGTDLQTRALADSCAVLDVNWRTSTGQRQLDSVSAAEREMSSPLDSGSTATCGRLGANCNPSTGQRQLDGVKLSCGSTPANPATFPRRSRTVLDVLDLWTWLPDLSSSEQPGAPRSVEESGPVEESHTSTSAPHDGGMKQEMSSPLGLSSANVVLNCGEMKREMSSPLSLLPAQTGVLRQPDCIQSEASPGGVKQEMSSPLGLSSASDEVRRGEKKEVPKLSGSALVAMLGPCRKPEQVWDFAPPKKINMHVESFDGDLELLPSYGQHALMRYWRHSVCLFA